MIAATVARCDAFAARNLIGAARLKQRGGGMTKLRTIIALTIAATAVGCVPKPEAPPAPEPAPVAPPPTPTPAPAPAVDWRDIALTPGSWRYDGARSAAFGTAGAAPLFALSCDRDNKRILLAPSGVAAGNTMTVRTSFGTRNLPLEVRQGSAQLIAAVPAADRFLDEIAFSRGRFTIDVPGAAQLVLPAWAEPARVIEDCRS
jgi:hypothetical protein